MIRVWRERDGIVHLAIVSGHPDGVDTFSPACLLRNKRVFIRLITPYTCFEHPSTPLTCLWCAVDPRRPSWIE